MSRPIEYVPTSPELFAVLKAASEANRAGQFDQAMYERTIRAAEAAGATLSDIQCIERYAIRMRLTRVPSLHT